MFVPLILAGVALASLALALWQWVECRLFPLHERKRDYSFAPPITVLKPLKGADDQTESCLRSWFEQDYRGEVQLLFGVHTADDHAAAVVGKLLAEFPKVDARLIVCGERLGANAKVSTLVQLERLARNDLLVISDADVRAPKDLLAELAAHSADARAGLLNPLYRVLARPNFAGRWEGVSVNADFWTSVLQSRRIEPTRFALGAVMCVRRLDVGRIGGIAALLDYLADDFELGRRAAESVGIVELLPVVVDCCHGRENWGQVWRRQLRWARTIRACRPVAYGLSIVSNTTLWALACFISAPCTWTGVLAAVCLAARLATAFDNERRLVQSAAHLPWFWMPLVKDLLAAVQWALAFAGNTVEWRGQRYRIVRGGKIEPA
ncbi:MAG: glycosyltransferase [Verrucomicrobia bacterium]|nr:glycosyltransferase [Verrucomicrobiota bacterium]